MIIKTLIALAAVLALSYLGWKLLARGSYETAQYSVVDAEGPFEIREYPQLMVATTGMCFESQGDDGSFMRLFRYISGANDEQQKVAMTTPVFMEPDASESPGRMGFVLPEKVAEAHIPNPSNDNVRIQERAGGRFAVFRFSGRISDALFSHAKAKLLQWMRQKGLESQGDAEIAGYDPPWTPGPLRRNEVLIRLAPPGPS